MFSLNVITLMKLYNQSKHYELSVLDAQKDNLLEARKSEIYGFFLTKGKLPQNIVDPDSKGIFQYKIADNENYFLCTTFEKEGPRHKKGYQCDLIKVRGLSSERIFPTPKPGEIEIAQFDLATSPSILQFADTTGFTKIEKELFIKITSFTIEDGGSVRIWVDIIVQDGSDYNIDLSNIKMRFVPVSGSPVIRSPLPDNTTLTLHPPTKVTQDLTYYAIGKGVTYEFEYVSPSGSIKLGSFN